MTAILTAVSVTSFVLGLVCLGQWLRLVVAR